MEARQVLASIPQFAVAAELGQTVHAAESLLARSRRAFRRLYLEADDD